MKSRLKIGERRSFLHKVGKDDVAMFETDMVHPVCSTFTLAKYIEWTSRMFVIDIKKEDEEGIGTMLHIDHISPAFINDKMSFEATVDTIEKNELNCNVIVSVGDRIIAKAKTGQKLLKRVRINEIFSSLETND